MFIEISIYCLSQREHGWHSRPPCATCCGQDGNPLPRLRGAFSHLAAHNGGLEKDGGEGMCGPGLCCCVRRGAGPNPQGAQQSRGSARPRRGVAAAVRDRKGEVRDRKGAGAARHPTATGGLHFPSKGALPGAVFPGKRLVSANESPAVLLPRLSVCC